jgi:hypothetical protein
METKSYLLADGISGQLLSFSLSICKWLKRTCLTTRSDVCGGDSLVLKLCLALANPWTVAHQASLSIGFPRQEYWSELPSIKCVQRPSTDQAFSSTSVVAITLAEHLP